ncbi:alpha-L-fucosidase [Phnomibacter sp. MR]|uniref:alpha-L-fucosidase n=1 Tax=Phnomibacter sp. MR TaxID=3042318 RepID=UPI003A7FD1AE
MNMKRLLTLLLASTCLHAAAQQQNMVWIAPTDSLPQILHKAVQVTPTPRQLRWQQLELTAFFHFGINTFTNREWGDGKENPQLFNPTQLDARQWVNTVKAAGIKQVIITAKHHDGFCLWPSKYTKHSVASSPWKNGKGDVVKEVADACREAGIGFGVYLSPWDRHEPSYGTEAYNTFFVQQLTELLTQYGQVDEVWFDGANGEGPNGKKQVYDFDRWYKVIRKLQPQATIAIMGPDVRWVGTETGHGRTTEWSVVPANHLDPAAVAANSQQDLAFKPAGDMMGDDLGSREKISKAKALVWYPAETDVSIRPGWFYHASEDSLVKSAEQLLDIYFHSVGRNGVLLLNIPPDKRGLIHEQDVKALQQWRQRRNDIFHRNLLSSAQSTLLYPNLLLDKNDSTAYTFDQQQTMQIEWKWRGLQDMNVLLLQEDIRKGQRVEKFVLEYLDEDGWKTAATGTTIGYKRLLRFPAVSTSAMRLRITGTRANPVLAEMGIYYDDKQPEHIND